MKSNFNKIVFGKRLKELRQKRNLTQRQLADQIKISPAALCQFENGIKMPSMKTVTNIIYALLCDANYLFKGTVFYNHSLL